MSQQYAQTTHTILMVRPVAFGFNPETAVNNFFQQATINPQKHALREFNHLVSILREKGVQVITVNDTLEPHTPDSIFPNNAMSFHQDGSVRLYPMFAANRRQEVRDAMLAAIKQQGFVINTVKDYRHFAEKNQFLEGTGSMVLDREHRIAYACRAQRTDEQLLAEFCEQYHLTPILFTAKQRIKGKRLPIYHTNVMMAVAETFVVICLDAIDSEIEKKQLLAAFEQTGKEVIAITEEQMHQFAGNMLQLRTHPVRHETALVMSAAAYRSLTAKQIEHIEHHCPIIYVDIPTIEANGGGSVRCMMAEIFLPRKPTCLKDKHD